MLAPVAYKLGIDLVWFGVLLGINMQTSFMHPPFGFALFFLRSVAPASVRTSEIYWGAAPFVVIQLIMVGIVIAAPSLVPGRLGATEDIDASQIQIEIPPPPDIMPPIEIPLPDEVTGDDFSHDEFADNAGTVRTNAPAPNAIEKNKKLQRFSADFA